MSRNKTTRLDQTRAAGDAIPIPAKALEQLEAIRLDGNTNMLDRPAVQRLAYDTEAWDLVVWLDEHQRDYAEGIFRGFTPEGEE